MPPSASDTGFVNARLFLKDLNDTERFGKVIGESLRPNSVIALEGEIGAGKTTLIKSIGVGLGVKEVINSPTFTTLNEYHSGRLPLFHFDLYRLEDRAKSHSALALLAVELEELLETPMVAVIEWADLFQLDEQKNFLDQIDHLIFRVGPGRDDFSRIIEIEAKGKSSEIMWKEISGKVFDMYIK